MAETALGIKWLHFLCLECTLCVSCTLALKTITKCSKLGLTRQLGQKQFFKIWIFLRYNSSYGQIAAWHHLTQYKTAHTSINKPWFLPWASMRKWTFIPRQRVKTVTYLKLSNTHSWYSIKNVTYMPNLLNISFKRQQLRPSFLSFQLHNNTVNTSNCYTQSLTRDVNIICNSDNQLILTATYWMHAVSDLMHPLLLRVLHWQL